MRTSAPIARRCLYGLIASSTLMLIGAQMSAADAADDAARVVVHYGHQDLASDASAQHLLRRIEVAAHEVCADQDREPLALHAAAQRCYLAAVAQAVATVNAPRVRAAYVAKYGPVAPSAQAREGRAPNPQRVQQG